MVGVTTALALQEQGHAVTLIDRLHPGSEASYGNAGIIQLEVMEPYAFPRAVSEIAKIALGMGNAVRYRLSALPSAAWPLWLYYRNSAPHQHARVSAVYRRLIDRSGPDHERLIEESASEHLIRRTGYLQMHRDPRAMEKDVRLADRYRQNFGVAVTVLNDAELREAEPALNMDFAGAVHWSQSLSCSDPGALVTAYANLFRRKGGAIMLANASGINRAAASWRVTLAQSQVQKLEAKHLIIALGAWSPEFLKPFGLSIPMIRKRGYHQHFTTAKPPTRPLFDVAASALYCPMAKWVRVTTGAEIARFEAMPEQVQITRAIASAREALALGAPVESEPWSGWRPCLPDMLPVVGAVPGYPSLWCNFGHGHQGFTLGPTTAEVLALKMTGAAKVDPFPELNPGRFA